MRGVLKREAGPDLAFVVEYESGRYRVSSGEGRRSVAIFDGERLLSYDGRSSAVVTAPESRATSCLAFDPRALGLSTGLFSDLTLTENIAYRSGKEIVSTRSAGKPGETETITIELTDRFAQRIRFDVEPRSPYRVHRYSKTIPRNDGAGIFIRYVTEAEYRGDGEDSWLPRRLVMYDQPEGDATRRSGETVAEFEKPEFVAGFDPETWTAKGLSLPVGQPVADLRIKRRIGYWDGHRLVENVPGGEAE